jgi:hypothetical protein
MEGRNMRTPTEKSKGARSRGLKGTTHESRDRRCGQCGGRDQSGPPPVLLTVRQFTVKHPAFPEASLRDLIYHADERYSSRGVIPGNGLLPAIYRVGRKVLIDEGGFFEWLARFRGRGAGVG